jgi:hypothetical protein
MRELKFRAWDEITEEWHYFNIYREMDVSNFYDNFSDYINIGQYTGLKDLYDGDFTEDGLIFWSDEYLGWFVKLFDYQYEEDIKPLHDCAHVIAIGNKNENPELLEKIK